MNTTGRVFEIEPKKIEEEARYEGQFVLQTDLDWNAAVALKYKELWLVEVTSAVTTVRYFILNRHGSHCGFKLLAFR